MTDTNAHAWAHRAAQACVRWDHAEHEHNHTAAGRARIEAAVPPCMPVREVPAGQLSLNPLRYP